MTKINNIIKNTSYFTLALILQKVISLTYFTLLARHLGPEDLGKYYFAISFVTIFSIFIDLGFANVLTREIAKYKEKASELLANVLALKIPLSLITIVVVILFINLIHYDSLIKTLVYIASISMVLDSFTTTFFAVMRGMHNLKYESITAVIFQIIVISIGYWFLSLNKNLLWMMSVLVLSSTYNFIYSFLILKYKMKVKIMLAYKKEVVKTMFLLSWPFALYAIFQRLYTYLDSVLLALLASNKQVGLYQISFKIIFAIQFIPLAFVASLYPAMSSYWHQDRKQLLISFTRAINYLIIISVPIVLGVIVLADKIVLLFKSGFSGAVLPLQISIVSLLFIFLNYPIGSLLNATDHQKRNTLNIFIITIISVVLNFILIPRWQAIGAAVTMVIVNFIFFILGIYWIKRIIPYKLKDSLIIFLKSLLSALLMFIVVYFGKEYANIFLITIIGAIIYVLSLFIFGGFKKEDILSIWRAIKV